MERIISDSEFDSSEEDCEDIQREYDSLIPEISVRQKPLPKGIKIKSRRWKIFGNSRCRFYLNAKKYAEENLDEKDYYFMDIYHSKYSKHWRKLYFKKYSDSVMESDMCPYRTWPRIFDGDKFIGGSTEFIELVDGEDSD